MVILNPDESHDASNNVSLSQVPVDPTTQVEINLATPLEIHEALNLR